MKKLAILFVLLLAGTFAFAESMNLDDVDKCKEVLMTAINNPKCKYIEFVYEGTTGETSVILTSNIVYFSIFKIDNEYCISLLNLGFTSDKNIWNYKYLKDGALQIEVPAFG